MEQHRRWKHYPEIDIYVLTPMPRICYTIRPNETEGTYRLELFGDGGTKPRREDICTGSLEETKAIAQRLREMDRTYRMHHPDAADSEILDYLCDVGGYVQLNIAEDIMQEDREVLANLARTPAIVWGNDNPWGMVSRLTPAGHCYIISKHRRENDPTCLEVSTGDGESDLKLIGTANDMAQAKAMCQAHLLTCTE